MAPAINFYAGAAQIYSLTASGLGLYGDSGFGATVQVGQWQGRTFISDSGGTAQGPEANNCKFLSTTGVILGQTGSGIGLNSIPNQQATFNIRFTNDSPVKVQNCTIVTYDRVSTSNPASGVTNALYEVVHPGSGQTADGSGGPSQTGLPHRWVMQSPTGFSAMPLSASPGTSGLSPSGSSTVDARHDWYIAFSASPLAIGSKTFAGFVQLEFL